MMQIVHDIAPGASLAFYTAFESEQDFANGILALAAAGCKVICDDVSYFDEPFFQNGVVAQAIQTVEAKASLTSRQPAITPATAIRRRGRRYQASSTARRSPTRRVSRQPRADRHHQYRRTGDDVPLLLEWNQAYGAATSDLEILVFHNGSLIGTATNRTSMEPTNPWVGIDFSATGTYQIAIENLSGPIPA